MVADAGYRLVDDPTAPEYLVSGITEEELRCAQVDLVFSHLIASDEHFRNFAKIGKILLAQKSPVPSAVPVQKGVRLRVARAIDAAFHRSAFDPDFRRLLLDNADAALSSILGNACQNVLGRVYFHDRPASGIAPPVQCSESLHLVLPEPVWQRPISEEDLERLIANAERE